MYSKDADKSDDASNQGARKPDLGVLRGGGDAAANESALAREFAAELEMHLADQALKAAERRDRIGPVEARPGPRLSGS